MEIRLFNTKNTDNKTINSNNFAKFEANQSESKLINGVAGKTTGHVILI